VVSQFGYGGTGDFADSIVRPVSIVTTVTPDIGGPDQIDTGDGANIVIAGSLADDVTGGVGSDLICGDHCEMTFVAPGAGETWRVSEMITVSPDITPGMR
jgi:hypothetical protein